MQLHLTCCFVVAVFLSETRKKRRKNRKKRKEIPRCCTKNWSAYISSRCFCLSFMLPFGKTMGEVLREPWRGNHELLKQREIFNDWRWSDRAALMSFKHKLLFELLKFQKQFSITATQPPQLYTSIVLHFLCTQKPFSCFIYFTLPNTHFNPETMCRCH